MITLHFECPHPEHSHQFSSDEIRRSWTEVCEVLDIKRRQPVPTNVAGFELGVASQVYEEIKKILPGIMLEPELPVPGMWLAIDVESESRDEWTISVVLKEYWQDGDNLAARIFAAAVTVAPEISYQLTPPRDVPVEIMWAKAYIGEEQPPPPRNIVLLRAKKSPGVLALQDRLTLGKKRGVQIVTILQAYTRLGTAAAFLASSMREEAVVLELPAQEYAAGQLISRLLLASVQQCIYEVKGDGVLLRLQGLPNPSEDGFIELEEDIVVMSPVMVDIARKTPILHN